MHGISVSRYAPSERIQRSWTFMSRESAYCSVLDSIGEKFIKDPDVTEEWNNAFSLLRVHRIVRTLSKSIIVFNQVQGTFS